MYKKLNVNGHVYDVELKKGSIVCFKTDHSTGPHDGITWGIVTDLFPSDYKGMAVEVMAIDPDYITPKVGITGQVKFERAFFHNTFLNIFESIADYMDHLADSVVFGKGADQNG